MRSRAAALAGSTLWFLIAPGSLIALLPWWLGGWRFTDEFGAGPTGALVGALLIVFGLGGLIDSFGRFALEGLATPAPITPTQRLIVTGAYRHVRNPMYVSVLATIVGQALFFGQAQLLAYAAAVWLAFHLFVLFHEEPSMRRRFPADYAEYFRCVPRWIPRLRPWNGASFSCPTGSRP